MANDQCKISTIIRLLMLRLTVNTIYHHYIGHFTNDKHENGWFACKRQHHHLKHVLYSFNIHSMYCDVPGFLDFFWFICLHFPIETENRYII